MILPPSRLPLALCAAWLFRAVTALAIQPSTRQELPNFDARSLAPPAAAESAEPAREAAAAELRRRVPGAHWERTAGAKSVGSTRGFLTGPAGEGGAVPVARARGFAAGDPHREVKAFLDEHRAFFGHGAGVLTTARTSRDVSHGRLRTTVWQQELEGIPIFEAVLQSNRTVDGELVNVSSALVPDPAKAAPKLRAAPTVSVTQAIALAAANLGEKSVAAANVVASAPATGRTRRQKFRAPKLLDVSAELVWLPLDEQTLRLCWQVVLVSKARGEMFKLLVDAESGAVLLRHGLTNYVTDASYRVFTSDSPSPLSPGHATPLTAQPPVVARTLVTTPALNLTASPNGWIDDGVNETRGNNVDAHTDLDANDLADTPRPQGSPFRVFDFALDLTQAPSTYRDASVTQLFYLCNRIHDRLYELGFTEAAGNFQNNNFGRGGAGSDAVQADAQDGEGTDNANFSTPPDGSPGRMQMFVFSGPTPDRDGDFDAEIVIHEYVHGLSNRLVGGGVGISALQSAGMGEGWSDFYALCILSEAGDDLGANYAAGGYATYQLDPTYETNYYFGIRRFPYSTDLAKNPLTFKDLDQAQIGAYPGVPRSAVVGGGGAGEVHNQGEVWCVALWEARANLVQKHGFPAGNDLILQLVTDGMKLAPANPNFLQARDAILQADLVLSGGANRDELWAAFAKRGMGARATSPGSGTTSGVVENFDLPDDLNISPAGRVTVRGPVGGPFAPGVENFTLGNSHATSALVWTATVDQPWLTLSAPGGTLAAGATTTCTATVNAAANALASGIHLGTLTFTNTNSGAVQSRTVRLLAGVPDFFTEVFDTSPNDTAFQSWLFTPDGSGSFYRVLRTGGVTAFHTDPTGGTNVTLPDDSSTQATLAGSAQVSLYGVSYASFHISSNGYVTFGAGDAEYEESAPAHFSRPRIAVLYDDLLPPSGGTISWRQLADRAAVTYAGVPEYGTTNSNSFQIEMFFDGRIRLTCLGLAATDGLLGLSRGLGEPADFAESDFSAYSALALTVNVPASATEGDAPGSGTVTAAMAPLTDLVVTLTSDDPTEATVPATVTILAGQTAASFALTVVDDAVLDGTHPVAITAAAPAYANTPDTILIHDNETATLTLTAPATVVEGAGTFPVTVTMSAPAGGAVEVFLTSGSPTELAVPSSVTIADGSTSTSFEVAVIDDEIINGPRAVTLAASVQNWTGDDALVSVQDDESKMLSIAVPTQLYENRTATGSVSTSGILATPLIVSLVSSVPARLSVPPTVTIPAGASAANFTLTATDNAATDGTQAVTISASAADFTGASGPTTVRDDDVHHFTFAAIASPQVRGVPLAVAITARDLGGAAIAIYSGAPTLSASGGLAITPTAASGFGNGVWTGSVTVNGFGTGVVLAVDDGAGHTGASPPFDVGIGTLDHFAWNPVSGPHSVGAPIPVTVIAQDAGGNIVTGFSGPANLSGVTGHANASTVVITEVNPNTPDEIEFMNVSGTAVNVSGWTVHLYDVDTWPAPLAAFTVPAGSTCAAGQIFRLQEFGTASGDFPQFFFGTNINWTSASSSRVAVLLRDAEGRMVDFFCGAAATPASITVPAPIPAAQWTGPTATAPGNDALDYARTGGADAHTATDWTPATPGLGTVNPGLTTPFPPGLSAVPIAPTVTGSFVNGAWSGAVTVLQPASQMRLRADDGAGREGESATFNVTDDSDGDGLPDAWESSFGLNPTSSAGDDGALGDVDRDGIANLLELALGLHPALSDATGLPVVSREIHPGDLQPYLVVRYRRLLAPGPLLYTLQVSPDLLSWTPATAADFEPTSAPTPNADGLTETVALRLKPALLTPGQTARHLRLEVRVP